MSTSRQAGTKPGHQRHFGVQLGAGWGVSCGQVEGEGPMQGDIGIAVHRRTRGGLAPP